MPTPVVTDKHIIIRMSDPALFDAQSFTTYWVDESAGIQEIIGQNSKSTKNEVQSYTFDKNRWTIDDARKWVKNHLKGGVQSRAELSLSQRSRIATAAIVCDTKSNLSMAKAPVVNPMDKSNEAFAKLNDKYYLHVNGVHEGRNRNGDYFSRDELTKNYKSAGYQPIDWEHWREETIGMSLDVELININDEPLTLSVNGIVNRTSPWMQMLTEVDGKVMLRDDLVRDAYFEDRLAISMETWFDSMKCTKCGQEFTDFIAFDIHVMTQHMHETEEVGRELIGVDFIGWGLLPISPPADPDAYITSLRTSDTGIIEDIVVEPSLQDSFGIAVAGNRSYAKAVANTIPTDSFDRKECVFASQKTLPVATSDYSQVAEGGVLYPNGLVPDLKSVTVTSTGASDIEWIQTALGSTEIQDTINHYKPGSNNTKITMKDFISNEEVEKLLKSLAKVTDNVNKVDDNENKIIKSGKKEDKLIEDNKKELSKGDIHMFDFVKKLTENCSLGDFLVTAQTALKDLQGDAPLTEEQYKAFASEVSEAIEKIVSAKDFVVTDIYTTTDKDRLNAINAARDEEKTIATNSISEAEAKYTKLENEKKVVEATLEETNKRIKELEQAEAVKKREKDIDVLMATLKDEYKVEIPELFVGFVRAEFNKALDSDKTEDAVKELQTKLVANAKSDELVIASDKNGDAVGPNDTGDKATSITAKFEKIHEEYKEKK